MSSNNCRPANCYRPLQQLYKTVYPPTCDNNPSHMNIACICRSSERYKTTNMTYGSFYYDNSISMKNNSPLNYDRALFARCYTNNNKQRQTIGYKSICSNEFSCKNPRCTPNNPCSACTISNRYDSYEKQYWTQPTNDACCPIDCCTKPSNCLNSYNPDPCSSIPNVQIRCI